MRQPDSDCRPACDNGIGKAPRTGLTSPSVRPPRPCRSRLTDRFVAQSEQCNDLAALERLLADTTRALGFHYFALASHDALRRDKHGLLLANYPPGWRRQLLAELGGAADPVHAASERTNCGFRWSDASSLVPLSLVQRNVLARAPAVGLGQGFTVPANIPGEPSASCSFATRVDQPFPNHRLQCAEIIGAQAFRVARQLSRIAAPLERVHLSRRELDCLRLLARGKTDWEIGHILGIGQETVKSYLRHARSLYGVVSRTQLVIHGLRDAHICFEDAIPPIG